MICLAYPEPAGTKWNPRERARSHCRARGVPIAWPSLPTLSGAILWNKTGTHGNRVLYVDNRGIVRPSGCGVHDPAGNSWWIATHKEDVSHEEMVKRAQAVKR